jgi:hypothetical protein
MRTTRTRRIAAVFSAIISAIRQAVAPHENVIIDAGFAKNDRRMGFFLRFGEIEIKD